MNIVFLFSCLISKDLSLALVALSASDVNSLIKIRKDDGISLPKWNSNNHNKHWDAKERLSTPTEREDNQVIQVNIPSNIVQKMEDSVMTIPVAMLDVLNSIKGNSQKVYFKKLHLKCSLNLSYFNVAVLRNWKCLKYYDEWSRIKFQRHLVQKASSKYKHGNPKLKDCFAHLSSRQKRSLSNSFTSNDNNRLSHSSKKWKGSTSFRKPKNRLVAKTLADYVPDAMEKKVKRKETGRPKIQITNDSAQQHTSSKFDNSKYRQLGHQLELERSKDPQWAFICMMGLMLLLAFCCYCCRLSRINRKYEIHVDFEERFHYVSLKDILKGKKRYLPMFKKKKPKRKYRQLKEVDLANPHSDTSEEELMLYDTSHQTYTGPKKKPRT